MSKPAVKLPIYAILDLKQNAFCSLDHIELVAADWLLKHRDFMLCYHDGGQAESIQGSYDCWSNYNRCNTCDGPVDEEMDECPHCGAAVYVREWEQQWQLIESWGNKHVVCVCVPFDTNDWYQQGNYFAILGPVDDIDPAELDAIRRRSAMFGEFRDGLEKKGRPASYDQEADAAQLLATIRETKNGNGDLFSWALINLIKSAFDEGFKQGQYFTEDS
jgi:hypothetical protein